MAAFTSQQPHYITIGSERLPLIATKHPRARSIVVRYEPHRDCVKVTMPRYVSVKRAIEFAQSRTAWIEKQRMKKQSVPFVHEAVIPFLGQEVTLVHEGGRGVVVREENHLRVPGDASFMPRRVHDYMRRQLELTLKELTMRHAARIDKKIASISIREMRSRWGSCSRDGRMSYSYRLAFAPYAVMEYVVCHEVAHLRHLDHSPRFWQLVAELCPDFAQHEAWLKAYGQTLWNYG